jgi:predicted amidohydrolase
MPRDKLIRLLSENPPTPAACLVLIWTYFRKIGLPQVENRARARYGHVLLLKPYLLVGSTGKPLATALEELRVEENDEFDLLALRLLKGLDGLLRAGEFEDFEDADLAGLDDQPYTVRRRNPFLASLYGDEFDEEAEGEGPGKKSKLGVVWVADQGGSLAAYCRHHVVVPSYSIEGYQILHKPTSKWGTRYLHDRLFSEQKKLRVMLWPFRTELKYPALVAMKEFPRPTSISLDQLQNEPELQAEVKVALEKAREERVTLLIFPELAIPPATDREIRHILSQQGVDGYPILTLFGCSHRKNARGDLDLNEAVLLGPDGGELHRHRKLTPFTDYQFGKDQPAGEILEVGTDITVIECALGNLTPLICIDLLNLEGISRALDHSHANLFAVPSLSPETRAHRDRAKYRQVANLASTFVCNRWSDKPSETSTSFYRVPRKEGLVKHQPDYADQPYLLFDLSQDLEEAAKVASAGGKK